MLLFYDLKKCSPVLAECCQYKDVLNVYMLPDVSLKDFKMLKKSKSEKERRFQELCAAEIGYSEDSIKELFFEMREKYVKPILARKIEKLNFEQIYWMMMLKKVGGMNYEFS